MIGEMLRIGKNLSEAEHWRASVIRPKNCSGFMVVAAMESQENLNYHKMVS